MNNFIKQRLFELFLGSLCYFALIEQNWYAQNLIEPVFIVLSLLSIFTSIYVHNDSDFLERVSKGLKVKTEVGKAYSVAFDFVILMLLWGFGFHVTGLFWFVSCFLGFAGRSKIDEYIKTHQTS